MQLLKIPDNTTRVQIGNLVNQLGKLNISFALEVIAPYLRKEIHYQLYLPQFLSSYFLASIFGKRLESVDEHSLFAPSGVHLVKYLKFRATDNFLNKTQDLFLDFFSSKNLREGLSLQFIYQPKKGANIRLISSAESCLRAGELLDELYQPFKNRFKILKPIFIDGALADFSWRRFNDGEKIFLTAAQLADILPLGSSGAPAPPSPPSADNVLQKIISGEVLIDDSSLEHYSTDGSIFRMKPWAVVLPKEKEDLVKLVKWISQKKSEIRNPKSEIFSITCRGKGTDQAGGPLNEGVVVRFPNYLDKILEIGADFIRVEPGVIWSAMNDELVKNGRFVPCYPASAKFATIGGGVANNCSGEKTVKYGSMRDYVLSLKMILADGKEVEFGHFNENEIKQKQAQTDLEGEIYRRMWDLLIANHNLIENSRLKVNKSSTGYWLYDVLTDGGADLTKLICGAQGTLGIITEVKLKTILKPIINRLLSA
jgi:hypothetical protein